MPKTLLLADDSRTIRRVVEQAFADTDVRVEATGSGESALARLADFMPDLVLAAVGLSSPSGYEICERVKRQAPGLPVLLLASTFEPYDEERARRAGADGCLVKPFDPEALRVAVRGLLDAASRPAAPPAPLDPPPALAREVPLPEAVVQAAHGLSAPALDALARAVAERLTTELVRQSVERILPPLVERLVRERLRERESAGDGTHGEGKGR